MIQSKNNVNVRAIAQGASEKNISAVINASNAKKALNTLHEQFFGEKIKELNFGTDCLKYLIPTSINFSRVVGTILIFVP